MDSLEIAYDLISAEMPVVYDKLEHGYGLYRMGDAGIFIRPGNKPNSFFLQIHTKHFNPHTPKPNKSIKMQVSQLSDLVPMFRVITDTIKLWQGDPGFHDCVPHNVSSDNIFLDNV